MTRAARAVIDTSALQHNLRVLRRHAGGARVTAVIKANAYGHGLEAAARGFAEADSFAVASSGEALAVRAVGLRQPVVLLEGPISVEDLACAAAQDFEVVVHSAHQIELLRAHRGGPVRVWLKVDTGMHRLGFALAEVRTAHAALLQCTAVAGPPNLMTHLACADETSAAANHAQLAAFAAFADLPGERSIANSAATLTLPEACADWVRPGLALYGASPFLGRTAAELGLRPAMKLVGELITLRTVPSGEAVGYQARWIASADTRIGIASLGYGDGFPRHAPNGALVLVAGVAVPLVGRVSMDMIALDLSGIAGAAVGSEVVAWGAALPIELLSASAGMIPYELMCGVSARVVRQLV